VSEPGRIDVLAVGQTSFDQVAVVDAAPPRGGKALASEWLESSGGQIATAALACARLGLRCALVSSVGDDPAAERVLAPLAAEGVDVARVARVPGAPTQRALIWIERTSGERTVLWRRDERLALSPSAVRPDDVRSARAVLLDAGDLPLALQVAKLARAADIPCVVDADTPAPGVAELLGAVAYPVISESLARTLHGTPERAVRALVAAGAEAAVVTLGAQGAVVASAREVFQSDAFAIEPRDTTGAGDAFHAGFVVGLLEGRPLRETVRLAHALAACNCRALGAQAGLPTRAELEAFLSAIENPLASGRPR
jgi:sugar/nucleoside kinase (ribokinase family)